MSSVSSANQTVTSGNLLSGVTAVLDESFRTNFPSTIRAQLSSEYRDRFHTSSILIVDNNQELGERVQAELQEIYTGKVNFVSSPTEALELLKTEKYDCIVLDVVMPGMSGTEFLQCLGGNAPAVVLHTMSISNDEFADISDRFGEYCISNSEQLIAEHSKRLEEVGIPPAAILRHHKSESLLGLVRKIDHAMLLDQYGFGHLQDFLDGYQAKRYPKTPSDECIHEFSELAIELSKRLERLSLDYSSSSSLPRGLQSPGIFDELSRLKALTFHNLKGSTPRDTSEKMHEARFFVTTLCQTTAEEVFDSPPPDLKKAWAEIMQAYESKMSVVLQKQRSISAGRKDAESLIREVADRAGFQNVAFGYGDEHPMSATPLTDPENLTEGLLLAVFEAFAHRSLPDNITVNCFVNVIDECERSDEGLNTRKALKHINAGSYLTLEFYDNSPESMDEVIGIMGPRLAGLTQSKIATFEYEKLDDSNFFLLHLKVSEYSGKPLDRDEISEVTEEGFLLDDLAVREKVVGDATYVLLGDGPESWGIEQKPIYFEYKNHRILGSGNSFSHAKCAHDIARYLVYLENGNDPMRYYWRSSKNCGYIYLNGTRLEQDAQGVKVEANEDDPLASRIVEVLNTFVDEEPNLFFSPHGFMPPAHYDFQEPPEKI